MGSRPGERRSHWGRGRFLVPALLGLALAFFFAAASFAAEPTIEAPSSGALQWSPSTATINVSESVTFKNGSASVPHGLSWTGGPETPSCSSSIPTSASGGTSWTGSCTFAQAGTYSFVCSVHASMTGSVTVNGSSGPEKPTVTTGTGTATGETTATVQGTVNPHGVSETKYFFEYGTTTAYGLETTKKTAGTGSSAESFSESLTGLTPETTYHFRLVAENSLGETKGGDKTLRTGGPPHVTTLAASGIATTSATLSGTVNPNGLTTTYFFNYGTTAAYGSTTSVKAAGAGTTNSSVAVAVTGLLPETTYHFQLVATNSVTTAHGLDETFTTPAEPESPPPPPPPPPAPPAPAPPSPAAPTGPAPASPPETTITAKPKARSADRTPTFKFKASVPGAKFECKLDGKPLRGCRSPLTTKPLSFGRHTLKVAAVAGGLRDATPAVATFKVVKPR